MQTKVDWGPVVLMLFFKALCLYLLVKWLETPVFFSWSLVGTIMACGLGFFDKFNLIGSLWLFGRNTCRLLARDSRKLTGVPKNLVAAMAIAIIAAGALVFIDRTLPLVQPPHMQSVSRRSQQILSLYESTPPAVPPLSCGSRGLLPCRCGPVGQCWLPPEFSIAGAAFLPPQAEFGLSRSLQGPAVLHLVSATVRCHFRADCNHAPG